jgi:hypothetical protein
MKKLISMLLLITVVAISCKKETGPTGPTGPQGPAGPAGTANVIYSPWIGFDAANWSATAIIEWGRNTRFYYDSIPEITQNILDQGAVMVFFKAAGIPEPQPLPLLTFNLSIAVNQYLNFRLNPGLMTITFFDVDDTDDPGIFSGTPSTNAYRYIIIPGGVPASNGAKNLKTLSYNELCTTLNIPE